MTLGRFSHMSDLVIHNVNISYDESDERVRNFIGYLKSPDRTEEMRNYYREVKSSVDNQIYLSDQFGNEFTLEYLGGHNCRLGLRGM